MANNRFHKALPHLIVRNICLAAIMLTVLAVPNLSCTQPSQPPEPEISENRAIMIAATNVPYRVIGSAHTILMLQEHTWIISFSLSGNTTVNKSELGWPEGPGTSFANNHLPEGTYSLLTFSVDGNTGEITSRMASDSIIIGGPGVFYTEPRPFTQQAWFPVLTAIGGLLAGAFIVWLFMRRKRSAS